MAERFSLEDKIKRFGKKRVLRALTKRRFTNKKRSEMRKTGQKHMGFMSGGFGIFSKSKNVEAGEPDKKKKKNVIKENVTKKQKRLEELKKELGMKKGGSTSKSKQKTKPKPKLFNKLKKHSRKGLTDK